LLTIAYIERTISDDIVNNLALKSRSRLILKDGGKRLCWHILCMLESEDSGRMADGQLD
jgi:hypothetical protein